MSIPTHGAGPPNIVTRFNGLINACRSGYATDISCRVYPYRPDAATSPDNWPVKLFSVFAITPVYVQLGLPLGANACNAATVSCDTPTIGLIGNWIKFRFRV